MQRVRLTVSDRLHLRGCDQCRRISVDVNNGRLGIIFERNILLSAAADAVNVCLLRIEFPAGVSVRKLRANQTFQRRGVLVDKGHREALLGGANRVLRFWGGEKNRRTGEQEEKFPHTRRFFHTPPEARERTRPAPPNSGKFAARVAPQYD